MCCCVSSNCCRKKHTLRLHNTNSVVLLFGLACEINEYARYANQGICNEQSHWFGCRGCNGDDAHHRMQRHEELPFRTWCTLWSLRSSTSIWQHDAGPCAAASSLPTSRSGLSAGAPVSSSRLPGSSLDSPAKPVWWKQLSSNSRLQFLQPGSTSRDAIDAV